MRSPTALALALAATLPACTQHHRETVPRVVVPTTAPRPAATSAPRPAVFHVAVTGDDTGVGTEATPWRTLGRGLAALAPGDTLVVHGGTYPERINLAATPAREDAPIHVRAADGERVVVAGLLWLQHPSWWTIEHINVTWARPNRRDEHMVKLEGGSSWRFTDAELWDARSFAAILVAGDVHNFLLARLYVHDTHPANGRNQDHLVYLNSGPGGGVVERCVLARSPNGRAIKLGPASRHDPAVEHVVVRYNTMVDNRGPSNVQLTGAASHNRIEHNLMVAPGAGRAAVTAFELTGRDNIVADNLAWLAPAVADQSAGIVDGGGNVIADPGLGDASSGYRPRAAAAAAYGASAP